MNLKSKMLKKMILMNALLFSNMTAVAASKKAFVFRPSDSTGYVQQSKRPYVSMFEKNINSSDKESVIHRNTKSNFTFKNMLTFIWKTGVTLGFALGFASVLHSVYRTSERTRELLETYNARFENLSKQYLENDMLLSENTAENLNIIFTVLKNVSDPDFLNQLEGLLAVSLQLSGSVEKIISSISHQIDNHPNSVEFLATQMMTRSLSPSSAT